MKLQYLGDSKDSFKWDYQDYLTNRLRYFTLNVVPMLTPDDRTGQGQTRPTLFPARQEVLNLCQDLRISRSLQDVRELPAATGAKYRVALHRPAEIFSGLSRPDYFGSIDASNDQIVLLDPDIGFEPSTCTDKHLGYEDVETVLDQVSEDSLVSVFQHYRYKHFRNDLEAIRTRMFSGYTTAIYWDRRLMFVGISRSKEVIEKVTAANVLYAKRTGLTALV